MRHQIEPRQGSYCNHWCYMVLVICMLAHSSIAREMSRDLAVRHEPLSFLTLWLFSLGLTRNLLREAQDLLR